MNDNNIKLTSLLESLLFLIIYIGFFFFISNTHKVIFILVSFFFMLRIAIDFILIILSFISDEKTRIFIYHLSSRKISIETSWTQRKKGITKWLYINYLVLISLLLLFTHN